MKTEFKMQINVLRVCFLVIAADFVYAFTFPKPKALSVDCSSQGNNSEFKHRLKHRKNAEDEATIWLFKDEQLHIHFHMANDAVIDVLDVRYSNDGGVDTLLLSLDNNVLGEFKTVQHFGWGDLWNTFESSGPLGGHQYLKAGNHKLTISVLEGDEYGVEIDYIRFNVHGSTVDHLRKDQFNCVHNPANGNEMSLREVFRRPLK